MSATKTAANVGAVGHPGGLSRGSENCKWSEGTALAGIWLGSCGAAWELGGSPAENAMRFCPWCGRPLAQVEG